MIGLPPGIIPSFFNVLHTHPNGRKESFEDVRHRDRENRTSGRNDAVDEAQVSLEVVAQDDEGRRVGQRGPASEQNAVGET